MCRLLNAGPDMLIILHYDDAMRNGHAPLMVSSALHTRNAALWPCKEALQLVEDSCSEDVNVYCRSWTTASMGILRLTT